MLYKLCVEGLLHHWDQRRGIHSEFTLDEKLRTCRELALAMQADDRAEYEAAKVQRIFSVTLGDPDRARSLLEHIRYRTGLLVERRAGMFAFSHLTFQEYLAAQAVYEGNRNGVDAKRLAQEHSDGRWSEVIALYCGCASANAARDMIEKLIAQPSTTELSEVLAEAYFSSGPKLSQDNKLRLKVIKRIAVAPGTSPSQLERFIQEEVAPVANSVLGKSDNSYDTSESYCWLFKHFNSVKETMLLKRLQKWREMTPLQIAELIHLLHICGTSNTLLCLADDASMYITTGPKFSRIDYSIQAEVAFQALSERPIGEVVKPGCTAVFLQILRAFSSIEFCYSNVYTSSFYLPRFIKNGIESITPENIAISMEFALLVRRWADKLSSDKESDPNLLQAANKLRAWADSLEKAAVVKDTLPSKKKAKSKTSDRKTNKPSQRKK